MTAEDKHCGKHCGKYFELGFEKEVELYVANTDKQVNTHSETPQCRYRKYQHSWNTDLLIK